MLDLTIAICAYNAAARLPAALEAIGAMDIPSDISWECLLIDNASTDETERVADDVGRRLGLRLRIVREAEQGLVFARRRAAIEARGEMVIFVDDDTWVRKDYAANGVRFLREHPKAGMVGGRIMAKFEEPASEPAGFNEHYAAALAIRDCGPMTRKLEGPDEDPPHGGGMVIRTAILRQVIVEIGCYCVGRKGSALSTGEDTEIGLICRKLGWETWYAPELEIWHVLPPRRLSREYLDDLIIAGAAANTWLDYLRGREPRRGRVGYYCLHVLWMWLATRMAWVKLIKGTKHRDAGRFPFWIRMYRSRADGYLELARTNPAANLEAAIKKVSAGRSI